MKRGRSETCGVKTPPGRRSAAISGSSVDVMAPACSIVVPSVRPPHDEERILAEKRIAPHVLAASTLSKQEGIVRVLGNLEERRTGVSRSAMISRHTGTNVPCSAKATNASNDVCFITHLCRRDPGPRGFGHNRWGRRPARPPLTLADRLAHQHFQTTDGYRARGPAVPLQRGVFRVETRS